MDYASWVSKIIEALGLSRRTISGQVVNGEWFLRPVDGAFSEKDAVALFGAVSEHLLGKAKKVELGAVLRSRLRELDGLETIPLLYAMSYVARKWGRSADFWPEFAERVLGEEIDVQVVRGAAQAFTAVWERLYRYSQGTLHYPLEGRTHIKWPLTHAGLLSDEESFIRLFGQHLMSQVGHDPSRPHSYLSYEVDEFQTVLLRWLYERGLGLRPFYRRLNSSETGLPVASIAQRYLQDIWENLVQGEGLAGGGAGTAFRQARLRLRFDLETRRVLVLMSDAQWAGRFDSVTVNFDGQGHNWRVAYNPTLDYTESSTIEMPISQPVWETAITANLGYHRHQSYEVLASPFREGKGALLFNALTGLRVRVLQPDETYILLIPEGLKSANWFTKIFSDRVPLAGLKGQWKGYLALQVTVGQLISLLKDPKEAESISGELLADRAQFRLPTVRELVRPRLRLLGGVPVHGMASVDACFSTGEAPLLEVTGTWPFGLTVALEKQEHGTIHYHSMGTVTLKPSTSPDTVVISLTEAQLEPGAYRVTAGDERLRFSIEADASLPVYPYRLSLAFLHQSERVAGTHFGMHLLAEGSFEVKAWPGAVLTIVVRGRNGTDRFPAQTANADGVLPFRLEDLYVGNVPQGHLQIAVEHGPAASETITLSSHPYCSDWQAEHVDNILVFSGSVEHGIIGEAVSAVLFGDEPWAGQIWEGKGTIDRHGRVRVSFRGSTQDVRYVALARGDAGPIGVPLLVARLPDVLPRTFDWRLGGDGHWHRWTPWMDWLHTHGVIDREIQQLAAFSKIMWEMKKRFGVIEGPAAGWIPPSSSLRADLRALMRFASAPRVALISESKRAPIVGNLAVRFHPDGPAPGVALNGTQAIQLLSEMVPTEGLSFETVENEWSDRITVLPADAPGWYAIKADETVIHCLSCGRVVPFRAMNYHRRPFFHRDELCNELTELFPGQFMVAQLMVEWLPAQLAEALADMFVDVINTKKAPTASIQKWIQELIPHMPRTATVAGWFREITITAAAMVELSAYPRLSLDGGRLMALTPVFDQYPEAVMKVVEWILHWLDGGVE